MNCPNKSLQEWQELEKALGEEGAMKFWISNGELLPPLEKVADFVRIYTTVNEHVYNSAIDKLTNELASEIEKNVDEVPINDILKKQFNMVNKQVGNLINKAKAGEKGAEYLRRLLSDKLEGDKLVTTKEALRRAKNVEDDIEHQRQKITSIVRATLQKGEYLNLMIEDVHAMLKSPENAKDYVSVIQSYLRMGLEWQQFIDNEMRPVFLKNTEFSKHLRDISGRTTDLKNLVAKNDTFAIIQALKPIIEPKANEYIKILKEDLEIQKNYLKTTKSLVKKAAINKRINVLNERIKNNEPSDENILNSFAGVKKVAQPNGTYKLENGDISALSLGVEAIQETSLMGPAAYGVYMQTLIRKVEERFNKADIEFGRELAPVFSELGSKWNPAKLGEKISFLDNRVDNNGEEYKEYHYLDKFKNVWGDKKKLELARKNAYDALNDNNDPEKVEELENTVEDANKALKKFQRNFFKNPYKKKYYELEDEKEKIYSDEAGKELKKDAEKLYNEIHEIENSVTNGQELNPDDELLLQSLRRDIVFLGKLTKPDGTAKRGIEMEKALKMKRIREINREQREYVPNHTRYERAKQLYEDYIKGQKDISPEEIVSKMAKWVQENTRTSIKEAFFKEKQAISKEIDILTSKRDSKEKKERITALWNEINDLIYGSRDEDNQAIGTLLPEEAAKKIRANQLEIQNIQNDARYSSGMSVKDWDDMQELYKKKASGDISPSEMEELHELEEIRDESGLSKEDAKKLKQLYAEYNALQSRIPTEYYIQEFNNLSQQHGTSIDDSGFIAEDGKLVPILESRVLRELLKHEDFDDWFSENHIESEKYNPETQKIEKVWKRTHQWDRIIPTNPDYMETLPIRKYSISKVRDELKEDLKEGRDIDNRGELLPKTMAEGALDDRYRNEEYFKLADAKEGTEEALLFKALNIIKNQDLAGQEYLPKESRRGTALPRYRKTTLESVMQSGVKAIPERIKSKYHSLTDYNQEEGNYAPISEDTSTKDKILSAYTRNVEVFRSQAFKYGIEESSLPITGAGDIDYKEVSLNLPRAVMLSTYSAMLNKEKQELLPLANAMERLLNIDFEAAKQSDSRAKATNSSALIKTYNNRQFLGITKNYELGEGIDKAAQAVTGLTYTYFLATNTMSGITHTMNGIYQNIVGSGNKYWSNSDLILGGRDAIVFMNAMMKDSTHIGKKSLEGQMLTTDHIIEPDSLDLHIGKEYSENYLKKLPSVGKDAISGFRGAGIKFFYLQLYTAALRGVKIEQMTKDGKKLIPLGQAHELDDNGIIKLKKGVSKEWDFNGAKREALMRYIQSINEGRHGAFDQGSKGTWANYTWYRLASSMKGFVPATFSEHYRADYYLNNPNIQRIGRGASMYIVYKVMQEVPILSQTLFLLSPILDPVVIAGAFSTIGMRSIPSFNVIRGSKWGDFSASMDALGNAIEQIGNNPQFTEAQKEGLRKTAKFLALRWGTAMLLNVLLGIAGAKLAGIMSSKKDDKEKNQLIKNALKNIDGMPEPKRMAMKLAIFQLMRLQVQHSTPLSTQQWANIILDLSAKTSIEDISKNPFWTTQIDREALKKGHFRLTGDVYGKKDAPKGEFEGEYKGVKDLEKMIGAKNTIDIFANSQNINEKDLDKIIESYYKGVYISQ